jgi:hypothetical protein
VKVERNVLAAMRDGTRLAADIYGPDDGAPHPAVVQRTPYNKSNQLYTFAATIDVVAFVERGYASTNRTAWTLRILRGLGTVSQRDRRRSRHSGMDRGRAVVQRTRRSLG